MYRIMMAISIIRTEKKRGRGRPRTNPTSIHLTVNPEVLAALEQFIKNEKRDLSRPEAIRELLADNLVKLGVMKPPRE
jgi:hypothetical protein